jgi:hypothetical protein
MNTTIKTEEPSSNDNDGMASCSSSINTANATSTQMKKEQEDRDDGDDDCATSRSRGLHVQVKKEKKEEKDDDDDDNPTDNINEFSTGDHCVDNDNYDDWKCGNWCWLLPAATCNDNNDNNDIKSEEGGGTKAATSPIMASGGKRTAARSHSTSHHEDTNDVDDDDDDDDETSQLSPPKKKTRSLKQHPSLNNRINDTVVEQQKEGVNACHKEGAKSRDDADDNNAADVDVDEGYESWTEGNWCWLLHTSRTNAEQDPSSDEEIDDTEITSISSSSRGNHVRSDNDSFSGSLLEEEEEEDEDEDEDEDGDDISEINAKRQNEWNEMFRRLVSYKKQYNSTTVSQNFATDIELGIWASHQQTLFRKKTLSNYRGNLLNSIGFVWNTYVDNKWNTMFNRLVTYKNQHGSILVPSKCKADNQLGHWVDTQRLYYKREILFADRIERLESIGFVWDVLDMQWMKMYDRLVAYKKKHKSTHVPLRQNQLASLGKWVYDQRALNRNGKLLKKRVECLNSIDFEWEAKR